MNETRSTLTDRSAALSPAKRKLLEMRLRGLSLDEEPRGGVAPRPESEDPLSFGQERIWFQRQIVPDAALHNIALLIHVDGPLDVPAMQASLDAIIRRHEVLRAGFQSRDGVPTQIIAPALTLGIRRIDLRALEPAQQEAELRRLADDEIGSPFDLARPPLLRLTLLELGPMRYGLLLTVHHIIWDGWSSGLFIEEFKALYEGIVSGRPDPTPPPRIQYPDFAYWQRRLLESEAGTRQVDYWKRQLAGLPPLLPFPTDRPRKAARQSRSAEYFWSLPPDIRAGLSDLGRRNGTSLFVTLLAWFKVLLFRYTGSSDIVVGTTIAYRTQPEFEKLLGFFANALVLRTPLQGDMSFETLLGRVHRMFLEAESNQDVPFGKLVEELAPKRDLSYNPLFQIAFVLHNLPFEKPALPGLSLSVEELSTGSPAFDLVFHVFDEPSGLTAKFEYDAELFDRSTLQLLAGCLKSLAAAVLAEPRRRIDSLPLLSTAEEKRLLEASRTVLPDLPAERLIHHRIDAVAQAHPTAVAVTCAGEQMTYGELVRRANQLAQHLRRLGVGPEGTVVLCMAPSVEMIVALLGILKADGAYVPVDPAYPEARLRYMTENCGAVAVVTTTMLAAGIPDTQARKICLDAEWN
jgi:hypothetical protein